ncbi:hypothetical protein MMC25_006638 [Agyrium rufum]|nr:hypothetical protein [Agyrium rufum]
MDLLLNYLPGAYDFYTNYYSPYEPYLRPIYRYVYYAQYYAYQYVFPWLWPAYKLISNLVVRASSETPDLFAIAILCIILFISMKMLDMVRRQIMSWISFWIRASVWIGVALLGFYVYQRGVDQSIEDFGYVLGYLGQLEDQGERIGQAKAQKKAAYAKGRTGSGPRGRTRGGGW